MNEGDAAMEGLVQALARESLGGEELLSDRIFRLGPGFRESREDRTTYMLEKGGCSMWGRCVGLEQEDLLSGRRWFRVEYPDDWREEMTRKGCERKASTCLEDYGKQFVEYGGKWYEVESEVLI
jgi:hypothetical protein